MERIKEVKVIKNIYNLKKDDILVYNNENDVFICKTTNRDVSANVTTEVTTSSTLSYETVDKYVGDYFEVIAVEELDPIEELELVKQELKALKDKINDKTGYYIPFKVSPRYYRPLLFDFI